MNAVRPADLARLEGALHELPIFPLPEVVFFPGVRLPLHVFEPRYRAMIQDCLATHGAIAIAQLLPGRDATGFPRLAQVVGGGVITDHQALPDGRTNILVQGLARLSLEELPFVAPYRRARARVLDDEGGELPASERAALVSAATLFAREIRKHDKTFSLRLPDEIEASRLADVCAFQFVVDAGVRQRVLEELRPVRRARLVIEELMMQSAALGTPHARGSAAN